MKDVLMKIVACLFLPGVFFTSSCQKQVRTDTGMPGAVFDLNIDFNAIVDAEPLLFDKPYKNFFQETYSVSAFKYYVSGIELLSSESDKVFSVSKNSHFLIDASKAASEFIALTATAEKYDRISFTIGVDSAKNVSGAQTGALDPANGMFWTWNSGYIMAKLEGNAPLSTQPNNKVEYHIGGFKGTDNVLKKVVLPFPGGRPVEFSPGSSATITITANVNDWFHNPNAIHIAQTPVCMTPGELSKNIAANYSKMFRITDISNN